MEFGLLKSKIESKLIESYNNKNFDSELKTFKKLVLENTETKKLYYLYDVLSSNKGYQESFAEDYVNECVNLYKNIKINSNVLKQLNKWTENVVVENQYKDIDMVLFKNTMNVESIIESKQRVIKTLSIIKEESEVINISMDKMVEVANNTVKNYLSTIDESEQKEIKKYISLPQSEIQKRYEVLSEMVIEKLEVMSESSEPEVLSKINETIEKIKSEKINVVSLVKLKNLTENL
jgi:hypothetical protein